jgi:hypothetical protein
VCVDKSGYVYSKDQTNMPSSYHSADIEKDAAGADYGHLTNDMVKSFSWENVTVTVKDRASKQPLDILSNVNGFVEAGELLALMGPRYVINYTFSFLGDND